MTRASLYCLPFLWLALSYPAQGGVIQRDWKIAGDGLLTFDDVNQREWLDLSETILNQFPGTNLEEHYQSVLAELDSGGMFEGFTVANGNDTTSLAQSAGIDTNSGDFDTNKFATSAIINLLSATITFGDEHQQSLGLLDQYAPPISPSCRCHEAAIFLVNADIGNPNRTHAQAGYGISHSSDAIRSLFSGVMLYRLTVPEPNSAVLCSICILVLLGRYPRNRWRPGFLQITTSLH